MRTLRTREGEERYRSIMAGRPKDGSCPLCKMDLIKDFKYWKIVGNDFPYERFAEVHHMIVPKRHVGEAELTEEEWQELRQIKDDDIHKNYGYILEATHNTRSIPDHFHLHLIVLHDI